MNNDLTLRLVGLIRPLPWLLLIFAGFYLGPLTSFHVGVDAELAAFRAVDPQVVLHGPLIWLAQGRWGVFLLERYVVPQTTVPVLPIASFGLFLSLGYALFLRAYGVRQMAMRHYLVFPLFAAFPIWFFLAEFSANIIWMGLGVALSGLAVLGQARVWAAGSRVDAAKWLGVQVASVAMAASIYQSLVMLVACGGLGAIVISALSSQSQTGIVLRKVALFTVTVMCGTLLYLVIWREALAYWNLTPDFVSGYMSLEKLKADPLRVVRTLLFEMRGVYAGGAWVYGTAARGFLLIPLMGLLALSRLNRLILMRCVLVALTLAILGLPFAQNLLSGGAMPFRSLVAVPVVMWTLAMITLEAEAAWLRKMAAAVILLANAHILHTAALFHAADTIAAQADARLVGRIYDDILHARLASGDTAHKKVAFFGAVSGVAMPYPTIETVGAQVFDWDGGDSRRIALLMKALGYSAIEPVGYAQWRGLLPEFATMPLWPAPGSVRVVGETTLVKLGAEPGHPSALMLEP